jgi:hypothetical protein
MSKLKWWITYTQNTEESLKPGDFHAYGWIDSEGTEWALGDQQGHHPEVLTKAEAGDFDHTGSLYDLLREADNYDCLEEESDGLYLRSPGRDWSIKRFILGDASLAGFRLQVSGVTESTKKRIHRLAESI